ncbi:clasp [Anaeramoeba flamelloides]|uniref:Clasp n=1 Tax=Anaeramoeba flamelloides TaxID=1746091 RepID=A0ABQ8XEI0_9EUKA|nr:clasp [Anaeramoeba flamelloides]
MVPSIAKLVSANNTDVKTKAINFMKKMFSLFGEPFQQLSEFVLNPKEFETVKTLLKDVVVVTNNNTTEFTIDLSQLQQQQQQQQQQKQKKQFQTKRSITKKKKNNMSPKKKQNPIINFNGKPNSKNEFSSSDELKSLINKNSKKSNVSSDWKVLSDKIPEKLISDEDHLEKELDKIYKYLTEKEGEHCDSQIESMIQFESLLNGNVSDYEIFYTKIQKFHDPFLVQLRDPRTQINKQICYLIANLSRRMKDRFNTTFLFLLNDLLRLVDQKKKGIARSGDFCIKISIHNTRAPTCILILHDVISKTKSIYLRMKCTEYLFLILSLWETSILEKYCKKIENILSFTIDNFDPGTRKFGRLSFWRYAQHFINNARLFYNKLQINTQKNLNKEKDPELTFINFGEQIKEPVFKPLKKKLYYSIKENSKNRHQRRINRKSPIKKINKKSPNKKLIEIKSNKFKDPNNHKHKLNHSNSHNGSHNRNKNNNNHQNNRNSKRISTRKKRRFVDSHIKNNFSRRQRNSSGQGQRKKKSIPTKSYSTKDNLKQNRNSSLPVCKIKSLNEMNQKSQNSQKKKSKILSKTFSSLILQLEKNTDLDLKESILIKIKKKILYSTTNFENNKLIEKLILCILKQLQLNEISIIQITLCILKILIVFEKKIFQKYRKKALQYLIPIMHLNEKISSMVIVLMKMIQHSYGDITNVLIIINNKLENKYQIICLDLILNNLQKFDDHWFKNEKNIKLIMDNALPILDKKEMNLIERAKSILKLCYENNQVSFFQLVLLLHNSKISLLKDTFSLILPSFNKKFEDYKTNKNNKKQIKNEKKKRKKTNKKPKRRPLSKSISLPSIPTQEVFFLMENVREIPKDDNYKQNINRRDGYKMNLEPKNDFIFKQKLKVNENKNKKEIDKQKKNNIYNQEDKNVKIEEGKMEKIVKVEKEAEVKKIQVKNNEKNDRKENSISKKQLNSKEIKKNSKNKIYKKTEQKKKINRVKHNQKTSINKKRKLKSKPSPNTKKTPNTTNKKPASKKRIIIKKIRKKSTKITLIKSPNTINKKPVEKISIKKKKPTPTKKTFQPNKTPNSTKKVPNSKNKRSMPKKRSIKKTPNKTQNPIKKKINSTNKKTTSKKKIILKKKKPTLIKKKPIPKCKKKTTTIKNTNTNNSKKNSNQ